MCRRASCRSRISRYGPPDSGPCPVRPAMLSLGVTETSLLRPDAERRQRGTLEKMACAWPWMTSGPAIPRSPGCAIIRSGRSRSTAASWPASRSRTAAGPSSPPSSAWPRMWAAPSPPKASKPRNSSGALRALGCERGQGFLFARPLAALRTRRGAQRLAGEVGRPAGPASARAPTPQTDRSAADPRARYRRLTAPIGHLADARPDRAGDHRH